MDKTKTPKVIIIPIVIPRGFLCPPVEDADKTIGRSGHIQGAAIVIKPEIKANRRSADIYLLYT
jgi:hypothetical protein